MDWFTKMDLAGHLENYWWIGGLICKWAYRKLVMYPACTFTVESWSWFDPFCMFVRLRLENGKINTPKNFKICEKKPREIALEQNWREIYAMMTSKQCQIANPAISLGCHRKWWAVFSYSQLYVGYSRVGNPANLYILSPYGKTKNVVCHEALQNWPSWSNLFNNNCTI